MPQVTSPDGTRIGYSVIGAGPAVVLVDGAMCARGGPLDPLARLLAERCTVYTYDRRGRGESGDTPPYTVRREIEDLAAVAAVAGTPAAHGMSSGAVLVLRAAAAGVPLRRISLYEAPLTEPDPAGAGEYTERLHRVLAAGRRGDAVALFLRRVGLPEPVIDSMRSGPGWPAFEAIAPTLAYDDAIVAGGRIPHEAAARIAVPALVLAGELSAGPMRDAAAALAAAIPHATLDTIAGQAHDVAAGAIAPVLADFLAAA